MVWSVDSPAGAPIRGPGGMLVSGHECGVDRDRPAQERADRASAAARHFWSEYLDGVTYEPLPIAPPKEPDSRRGGARRK